MIGDDVRLWAEPQTNTDCIPYQCAFCGAAFLRRTVWALWIDRITYQPRYHTVRLRQRCCSASCVERHTRYLRSCFLANGTISVRDLRGMT